MHLVCTLLIGACLNSSYGDASSILRRTGASHSQESQEKATEKQQAETSKALKIGHPQTCVYPDVCLGIAHVSGKVPLSGQGVW